MNPALQDTLLQLFEQVHHDPDSLPVVPIDEWQEGSTERQLLTSFSSMMEQVQQRTLQFRKMEQQLREREEQYRSVFEATGDGLFVIDLDGFIVEANPAAYRQLGYTYEEIIGLHRSTIVNPEYHSLVPEYLRVIQMGDQFQGRAIDVRKDGTTFPVEVLGRAFTYKGRPHTLSVVRDITKQVQAEEQLREREEQYRSIFEAVTDSLTIARQEDGQIVEANPAACKMLGYSYEEMIGKFPAELVPPDFLPLVAEGLQEIQVGERNDPPPMVVLRKDGSSILVEAHSTQFTYKGKSHHLTVARDITERVEAERQLREREEQYRSVFEATDDGLVIQDLEGFFIEVNPAFSRMLGYTHEELIGLHYSRVTYPEYYPVVEENTQKVQAEGRAQAQGFARRKDGSSLPVEAHSTSFTYQGKPHVLGVMRDITERVEAERQVREREEQYRSIFEATYDALFIMDLDGFLVEVNPAFCRMFSYSYEEVIGLHSSVFTAPVSLPNLAESLKELKAGRDIQTQVGQGLRKDGTVFYNEAHSTTFTYRGKPHALGVVRDITERVEAEKQLREKQAQYRAVFEATTDALVVLDPDGFYVEANPAMCRMFGYTAEELMGMHAGALTAQASDQVLTESVEKIKVGEGFQAEGQGVRKDGTVFYAETHLTPFTYQGELHLLASTRDITERVQAQQLLEQGVEERTRELASLLEISHTVASTLQLKPLLGLILDQLKTVVDYTSAAILTVEGDDMVLLDGRSPTPEEQLRQIRFLPQRLGPIWEMITSGQSIRLTDMRDESPLAQTLCVGMGELMDTTFSYVRASLFVPMTLKDSVIGMLVLTSSEAGAFTPHHTTLALAIANQAAIAIENARLYEQAQELAAVEERQRLARELHDSVSQALYGISLGAHTARMQLDRDPRDLAESLDYVLELAEAALVEMRALIFELRPESLETEGIVTALTKQAVALQARQNISVNPDLCAEPDLPLKVKQDLYRIAQEALHNTVKHAHASRIALRLHQTREAVTLEVCDNGKGFDATASFPGHLGLHSMQERVTGLGGELKIESTPGQGTCIRVQIPGRDVM